MQKRLGMECFALPVCETLGASLVPYLNRRLRYGLPANSRLGLQRQRNYKNDEQQHNKNDNPSH
jgi:hypothetical protein